MRLTDLERVTRMISPGPESVLERDFLHSQDPNMFVATELIEPTMEEPLRMLLLASFWRCSFTRWSMSSSSSSSSWNSKYRFRVSKVRSSKTKKLPWVGAIIIAQLWGVMRTYMHIILILCLPFQASKLYSHPLFLISKEQDRNISFPFDCPNPTIPLYFNQNKYLFELPTIYQATYYKVKETVKTVFSFKRFNNQIYFRNLEEAKIHVAFS